jgi:hypothetical protein
MTISSSHLQRWAMLICPGSHHHQLEGQCEISDPFSVEFIFCWTRFMHLLPPTKASFNRINCSKHFINDFNRVIAAYDVTCTRSRASYISTVESELYNIVVSQFPRRFFSLKTIQKLATSLPFQNIERYVEIYTSKYASGTILMFHKC